MLAHRAWGTGVILFAIACEAFVPRPPEFWDGVIEDKPVTPPLRTGLELQTTDLTPWFEGLQGCTGKHALRVPSGEFVLPAHLARVVVRGHLRLVGEDRASTFVHWRAYQKAFVMALGGSLEFVNMTVDGTTIGQVEWQGALISR